MSATPRPWSVEPYTEYANDGSLAYGGFTFYDSLGCAFEPGENDGPLVVTAVNEHDALVAKVAAAEAARLLLSDAIRKYAAGVEHQRGVMEAAKKALATLDAALGDQR